MFETDKEKNVIILALERNGHGLTQKALAEKLFISDKAVSKWDGGGYQ